MKTNSILILGGGSAGWMTAATFIRLFPEKQITLVEAPNISTIGVGESTTQFIREWLDLLGIRDSDWMKECDATYKLSVRFENFNSFGIPFHYPFSPPKEDDDISTWFIHKTVTDASVDTFAKWWAPHYKSIVENRIPQQDFSSFRMAEDSGFHMDAVKFANWLKTKICIPEGVRHVEGEVVSYEKHENGHLKSVTTEDGRVFESDIFIDCTGFRSYLNQEVMESGWEDFSEMLPNDSAWAVRLPYTNKQEQMKVYTNCTALGNGWVWNVPLRNRIGTGYNYSSKFISDEDALTEFKNYLGDPETLCEYRNIKFKTGLSRKPWNKNVIAIGLSGGFIEPLESNGLLSVHQWLVWICQIISNRKKLGIIDANSFNHRARGFFKVFAHFVMYHYTLSERNDTPYWDYMTNQYDCLGDLHMEDVYMIRESVTPLDRLRHERWTYHNYGGVAFIAAGHGYNPFSEVTLKLLDSRGQLDRNSYINITDHKQFDELQETFPFAVDYYEQD